MKYALPGGRVEAQWWGPAPDAAPSIVLLHEGLGCIALWRDFPANLAATTGLGVLAFSRLGYGRSDPVALPRPMRYMHEEAETQLPALLDAAGIRRCVLLGHSDGASIAAIHAGCVADARLAATVLIAPHFFVEPISLVGIAAARDAYRQGGLRARLARYHADVDIAFHGWNDAWLSAAFAQWRIDAALPGIIVPLLAIQGSEDEYGTPAQLDCAQRLAGGQVETLLIPGAGHAPFLTHADIVLAEIARFLAPIRAASPC